MLELPINIKKNNDEFAFPQFLKSGQNVDWLCHGRDISVLSFWTTEHSTMDKKSDFTVGRATCPSSLKLVSFFRTATN